jgi:hypothetical protein
VTVIVGDDDAPNIVVAPISLTVCEPDDSDIFVVSLSSRPAAQVTIPLSATNGQCGVSPGLLTLGTDNWATGATATVSAIDDDDDDDEQICTVETLPANSNDPLYNGLDAANVIVIVEDDEILTYLPVVAYKWPPYPGVPTLEPISNPDNDGIYAVHWSAAPHAEVYILEEDTDNTFPDPSEIYTGPSTNYVVSDRGASRLYYRVKSRNAWGDSEWSGVRRVDVLWEAEPNGEPLTEANGPLVSGLTYYGTFVSSADLEDYFYIKLSSPHYVEIWLTNIAYGQDYDLVLRNENLVYLGYSGELGNANEHIRTKLLPAGKYYIQVFRASEGGSTQPYHLKVVYE